MEVKTKAITKDSKVFVTLRSAIGTTVYVDSVEQGRFTVKLSGVQEQEVKFDWWVVN